MGDFIANTQISVPLSDPRLKADVDLNGLKFSYQFGMFYEASETYLPITMPPPFDTTPGNRP
jgi:hypothetical protein